MLMGKTRPCPCPRGAHTPAVTKVVSSVLGKSYQLDLYSEPGTCPLLPLPPSPCGLPLDPQASSSLVPCSSPNSLVSHSVRPCLSPARSFCGSISLRKKPVSSPVVHKFLLDLPLLPACPPLSSRAPSLPRPQPLRLTSSL